ncbi:MAG: c-type cytochrome [Betaproteobacteria bacterium]|nr:c-type cytochrome [Betaproteobacteria bacterium]
MKQVVIFFAAAAAATLAAGAHAADPKAAEALAKTSGCFACHTMDKKLVGPSYKDIANKYRKDKGAEANLVKKVKAGGKGAWGDVPMPPNAHVKDDDIRSIVKWVLSLK